MTRDEVRQLQRLLNEQGFTDQNGKPLKEDGILGPRTAHALQAHQQANQPGRMSPEMAHPMPTPRPKPAPPPMATPRDHPNRPSLRRDIDDFAAQGTGIPQLAAMREPAQPTPRPYDNPHRDPDARLGFQREGGAPPFGGRKTGRISGDLTDNGRYADEMYQAGNMAIESNLDRDHAAVAAAQAPSRVQRTPTGPGPMLDEYPGQQSDPGGGQGLAYGDTSPEALQAALAEKARIARALMEMEQPPQGDMPWDQSEQGNPMVAEGAPPAPTGPNPLLRFLGEGMDPLRRLLGAKAWADEPSPEQQRMIRALEGRR